MEGKEKMSKRRTERSFRHDNSPSFQTSQRNFRRVTGQKSENGGRPFAKIFLKSI